MECQGTVRAPEIKKNNNLKIRGQRENGVWGEKCGDKAKGMECKVREGKVKCQRGWQLSDASTLYFPSLSHTALLFTLDLFSTVPSPQ